jgi:methylamine utilization protein MauE
MSSEPLVEGAQLVLALVFGLAALEKGLVIRSRTVRWHPVVLAHPRIRPHAAALMAVAITLDVAAVLCLLLAPAVGALVAGALIVAYTYLGLHVDHGGGASCRCLWKGFDSRTRRALLVRNACLAISTVVVVASAPVASTSGLAPGAVLATVLALIVATLNRSGARPAYSGSAPVIHIKEGT